jgi:hypothetical protein
VLQHVIGQQEGIEGVDRRGQRNFQNCEAAEKTGEAVRGKSSRQRPMKRDPAAKIKQRRQQIERGDPGRERPRSEDRLSDGRHPGTLSRAGQNRLRIRATPHCGGF